MKTLTVRLPEPLVAEIEMESRGRKCSKSDIVRERLQQPARPTEHQATPLDSIAYLIGSIDGLPADLVALLSRRDSFHNWAATIAPDYSPPWRTCEAVLSEAFHLLGTRGAPGLSALIAACDLDNDLESIIKLLQKYADVPMSLADACLVRMSETFSDPIILTTDLDFRIYRRHSRQTVPCKLPS